MKELKNCEFDRVTKLLDLEKVHCIFAYAVIEGKQPGKVYVDNSIDPKSCFIVCKSGKYLVAVVTCSEFIKHCLLNNIEPVWDCDDGNEGFKKLAVKLGFESAENYKMHWWHENKSYVDAYLKKFNYNA